nr:tetraacyldisaccharide 4'-kinase [Pontivivens insulae]
MRTPKFWSRPPGWQSFLLSPLAMIWGIGAARRQREGQPRKADCPVLCVGNLTVGGTGKSPTVILLVEKLRALGASPVILSRGHGGSVDGPHVVTEADTAAKVGDEPVMLSAFAPVVVARDRVDGARCAVEQAGADIIVMDDGFQDPSLHKDLSLLVVDGQIGFGNGKLLPAGPLREKVADGLVRADLALLIGGQAGRAALGALPVSTGTVAPLATGMPWKGLRVIAFAGIGRPEKFFDTLKELGATIVRTHAFADHEPYNSTILDRMRGDAKVARAQLVTTEKDAARLPRGFLKFVLPVPVRLTLEDGAALDAALTELVGQITPQ